MSREKGTHYELEALRYLQKNGLSLLEKNFRTRFGEIDLVMLDSECLTCVEVRYRTANRFSNASDTIDEVKQMKIIQAAEYFLCKKPHHADRIVRFDVVAFDGGEKSPDRIRWLQDAFRA